MLDYGRISSVRTDSKSWNLGIGQELASHRIPGDVILRAFRVDRDGPTAGEGSRLGETGLRKSVHRISHKPSQPPKFYCSLLGSLLHTYPFILHFQPS